jgi:F1F0 ATPase subunit 2
VRLDVLSLGLAFAVGVGVGFIHFGGLWLTIQRLATARQPHLLLGASALGRLGISVAGFYVVLGGGNWLHLLVCLGGFLGVRRFLIRRWRPASGQLPSPGVIRHGYHTD